MKIRTAYQVVEEDNEGCPVPCQRFFWRSEDALEASKPGTWSKQGRNPKLVSVLENDAGEFFILGEQIVVRESVKDDVRLTALAKLSDEEKVALGLVTKTTCDRCHHRVHAGKTCNHNVSGKLGYQKVECDCEG